MLSQRTILSACMVLGLYALSAQPNKKVKAPEEPDYSQLTYWAAHPAKLDPSDSIPAFAKTQKRDTVVDVFFVHPTSYLGNLATSKWSASLDDARINKITDAGAILFQASVFNQHAKIYAPRYRQAHIKSFFLPNNPASPKAIDLAYADVKKAFLYYMEHLNHGRPFIIAAHSQGTLHAIKLLQEFVDGEDLQDRMVCAYLVGWAVTADDFEDIKPCTTATQTKGFVSWRTFKQGEVPNFVKQEQGRAFCVNPVTWQPDYTAILPTQHLGAIGKDLNTVYEKSVETSVQKQYGILWATPKDALAKQLQKVDNYHFVDYNLFYLDIRNNVDQRIKAFLKQED